MDDFIPSIKVAFYISADKFDIDEVTRKVGINPTGTRTNADFPEQSIAAGVAKTIWWFEVEEENCIAVSILFKKLLIILDSKSKIINAICNDYGLETGFEVVIHCQDGNNPELVLTREIVAFAASINAEIGFDLYCYE